MLKLVNHTLLLLVLSFQLGHLSLQLQEGLAAAHLATLGLARLLFALIMVATCLLLGFQMHIADLLDLGQAQVEKLSLLAAE